MWPKLFGNHYFMVAIYIPVLRTKSIKYFHHYFYKYTVYNVESFLALAFARNHTEHCCYSSQDQET